MNPHYSEADLLETYYTQPGESLPVMLHLADCADCAARYERLEAKIRGLAACHHEQPAHFWDRQRNAILRKVRQPRAATAFARFATAAMLALAIGGTLYWPLRDEPAAEPEVLTVTESPWESEPLQEYQPLVEWESWVEEGGQS
jgi:predicted anti-sigma-YlaC factor YlaD